MLTYARDVRPARTSNQVKLIKNFFVTKHFLMMSKFSANIASLKKICDVSSAVSGATYRTCTRGMHGGEILCVPARYSLVNKDRFCV